MGMLDRSAKILIVEDEPAILELATETLRDAGYEVVTASDGMQAIMLLSEQEDISLLFTDIRLPLIDGLTLADMAKARRPGLTILYTTGFADELCSRPDLRRGETLAKPYRQPELSMAVRELLARPRG